MIKREELWTKNKVARETEIVYDLQIKKRKEKNMLENFIIIGKQILIVFLLMMIGYVGGKKKKISDVLADGLAGIAMNLSIPASILLAFQREFETRLVRELLLSALLAAVGYVIFIFIAWITIRDEDRKRQNTLRFTAVFANCAMVALPLQSAMFGTDGVFCGAVAIGMFDLLFWPLGALSFAEGEKRNVIRKSFMHPCVIANVIALILFFGRITIPEVPKQAMSALAGMNLPLCMIVLGQKLTRKPLQQLFTEKGSLLASAEKLILFPMLMIFVMWFFHVRGVVAVSALIAMAAPSAASVVMLAVTYRQDAELASRSVAVSTMLSLLTMPPILVLGCALLL